jgi:hypothetical protein
MSDGTDPDGQHGLHNIRGNGVWAFRPDLREGEIDKYIYDRLPVAPGKPGHLTFKVSAANVIASLRIEARVFRRTREDGVRILVSKTAGIRWMPVWEASGTGVESVHLALRDEVAGHTECLVRFEMRVARDARDVGLQAVSFDTITQLNRRALPRLRRGTNRISLRAGEALESIVLWPKLHGGGHLETVHRAEGVHSAEETDGAYKATLGAAVDGKPGFAIWKLEAPTDIVRLRYAVVATNRSPRSRVALLHSWDGERFEEFFSDATGDGPFDREVLHEISGASVPPGRRTAWLQGLFETPEGAGTWNMPGIQDVAVEVQHRPRLLGTSPPLLVTYAWTEHRREGAVRRTHVERIEKLPHDYEIHVGGYRDPTMEWVRLALEGEASSGASSGVPSPLGYSDGVDLGPSPPRIRSTFAWGENLALGKPYSTSRPSSEASGNVDEGSRELTNGIVIAPTELRTQAAVRPASAFWDRGGPVAIEIDLERVRSISAVRVVTHQPEAAWCHPARLDFAVSEDGKSWTLVASATHDDVWNPPADDEPWEHEDSPRFAALPAGGRLVHTFQGILPGPADARFVRVTAAALEGRGMGLSEIQVFDRVAIEPFPEDIVHGDGELPSGSKSKPGS